MVCDQNPWLYVFNRIGLHSIRMIVVYSVGQNPLEVSQQLIVGISIRL